MDKINQNISEARLKVKSNCRDRIDILLNRLSMLNGQDKLLMTMYWGNGNSLRQIAGITGIHRASLARRINKITRRLMEGKYITCIRNRKRFTESQMAIAKDYFLVGLSMRKIAEKRGLSYYQVRKIIQKIERKIQLISIDSSESIEQPIVKKPVVEQQDNKYGGV
jgi:predicted DNA-binding protein YlxM (UPF0122 family)